MKRQENSMLYGKTIVITGVSSGIGARTAELALQLGADVIGIDRREPDARLESFVEGDLSTAAGVDEILAHLPPRFDALCNVAGVSGTLGAAKTLAINFYGLRALSLAVAPRLREGGAIVSVASIAGYGWRANLERTKALVDTVGFPDTPDVAGNHVVNDAEGYPVSKEALLLWTQRAAREEPFKARGIRINAVSPGPVATPILREFRAVFGDARVDSDIAAVGRPGTASDVAPAILFLCSDGARWINGANLPVDGGLEAAVNAGTLGF
jgi:NAD(P)-dependent dehydrogenase (short-subunit alcohol dehydrogenase family)